MKIHRSFRYNFLMFKMTSCKQINKTVQLSSCLLTLRDILGVINRAFWTFLLATIYSNWLRKRVVLKT